MVTSESGAPADGSGAQPSDPQAPGDVDNVLEDIPTFLVTRFVENATCAAVDFLHCTNAAFEDSLNTALAGNYTAGRLAKDTAALWARNLRFASRLFSVGAPGEPTTGPTDEGRTAPVSHRSD